MKLEEIKDIVHWVKSYKAIAVDRILLGSNDIPSELRPHVATQVQIQGKLNQKLPDWGKHDVYIPKTLNLEQASSQEAGDYKRAFISSDDTLLDLTGGLAVDFFHLAQSAKKAIYVEQDRELYEASVYNLSSLLDKSVDYEMFCFDSMEHLQDLFERYAPSFIYVDPARREAQTNTAKRTYAIEDCSPNLYQLIEEIQEFDLDYQPRILAKLSPMLDLKYCLDNVPKLKSVHILAVHNEVKELLLEIDLSLGEEHCNRSHTKIVATDLYRHRPKTEFSSSWEEEAKENLLLANSLGAYVYEPNGAVMKTGLFKSMAKQYNMPLLHSNTHLYTSEERYKDFAGRCFEVKEVLDFSSSLIKKLHKSLPKANVICRNFPLKADVLQKKLKIKGGGEQFILATTLWDKRQVLLICYLCKYDG